MAREVAHLLTIFGADADGHPLYTLECRATKGYDMPCGAREECGCPEGTDTDVCPSSPTGQHSYGELGWVKPVGTCWVSEWDERDEEILAFVETQEANREEWRGLWLVSFDTDPESPAMEALACLTPDVQFRHAEVLLGDPAAAVRFPMAGIEIKVQEEIEATIFVELGEDGDIEVDASAAVAAILPMIREST